MARVEVLVSGRVQGVGFRYWVRRRAEPLGLAGAATNLPDGRVEVVAEGPRDGLVELVAALQGDETPGFVRSAQVRWADPVGEPVGFRIR